MLRQPGPDVHGRTRTAAYVVDEVRVAGTQLQDVELGPDQSLEVAGAERRPERFPVGIGREARAPVAVVRQAGGHPNTIPRIIRIPTANARRLLTLPPLLLPTRA